MFKRTRRPVASSSSSSESDSDDAPMEMTMSFLKQQQQEDQQRLADIQQHQDAQRQKELQVKKENQIKRQKIMENQRKELLLRQNAEEESEDGDQLVQLPSIPPQNDEFDFDMDTLLAAQEKKVQLKKIQHSFAISEREQQLAEEKKVLAAKKEKQAIIESLLKEQEKHDFSTKSAKFGRFNIVSQQGQIGKAKRRSPRDMLEMVNGSTKGQNVQEVGMRLRTCARIHQDVSSVVGTKGIAISLLNKSQSKQQKNKRIIKGQKQ